MVDGETVVLCQAMAQPQASIGVAMRTVELGGHGPDGCWRWPKRVLVGRKPGH